MATPMHSPPPEERIDEGRSRAHRFSYLLLAEFALILGFPALRHLGLGLYGLLGVGVFAAALYAVFGEGRLTAIAFALGVPAILGNLSAGLGQNQVFFIPGLVFGVLFLVFVAAVILKSVVATARVTMETLYGAIAAYVLVGLTFGSVYFLMETIWPATFRSTVSPEAQILAPDCLFFSFITLTTIGYGDIVPASAMAKSFVILEAVTGIMYPAVMIARLVALYSSRGRHC